MTLDERLQPALQLRPEVASLNMGSMNFGLYEMLDRFKDFKRDWEGPYLSGSDDLIFRNTFKDIAYILQSCSEPASVQTAVPDVSISAHKTGTPSASGGS